MIRKFHHIKIVNLLNEHFKYFLIIEVLDLNQIKKVLNNLKK